MDHIPYYPRVTVKFREAAHDKVNLMDIIIRECRAAKIPRADLSKFHTELEKLNYNEMVAWAEARFTTVR
jgi:hypothetical protein